MKDQHWNSPEGFKFYEQQYLWSKAEGMAALAAAYGSPTFWAGMATLPKPVFDQIAEHLGVEDYNRFVDLSCSGSSICEKVAKWAATQEEKMNPVKKRMR